MKKIAGFRCAVMVGLIAAAFLCFGSIGPADAAEPSAKDQLIVSGGTIGGTTNLAANALAAVIYRFCKIPTSITTNSSMGQITALRKKEADIVTGVGYQAYDAYTGALKGGPYTDVRTLFQCTEQQYYFVTMKKSPIRSFMDLKGKRVVVGKKGFFAEDVTRRIHVALGLEYGKFFTPLFLGHGDASASLVNGTVDAYVVMAAIPQPTVAEIAESHDCNVLALGKDIMEKVVSKDPNFAKAVIPAGAYKGMDKEAYSVTAWFFYNADKRLSDDIAYCTTKNFFENLDFAATNYVKIKNFKLKDIEEFMSVPYHKGALRYYKEKGLKIPDGMIPPEAK